MRAIPAARGGPAVFLSRAFAQNLDATSLRCRAVKAMLPVDGALALRMFREIPQPAPAPLSCKDALAYDLSAYYETLAEVAGKAFTPAEIEEEEPFKLLAGYVQGVAFPAQVAPVARMLASAAVTRPHLETLAATFAGRLKELAGDDRSFSDSISRQGGAGPAIAALAARCKQLEIPTAGLVEAYRSYMVRHFRSARCEDGGEAPDISFGMAVSPDDEKRADPVAYFNERLREDPVPPLAAEDLAPSKLEGSASGTRPCDSQDCRHIAELYRSLVFGKDGLPYTQQQKATGEWQAQAKEFLTALAEWKGDGLPAAELFQQKCWFYSEIASVTPNGPNRVMVLRAFLDFLKQNTFQQKSRIEWFLPVNSLIARASLDPLGLKDLWTELRASGDSVIALYAALEEIAPRPPDVRLSIF